MGGDFQVIGMKIDTAIEQDIFLPFKGKFPC